MAKFSQIVDRNRASQGLRFLNYLIDLFFCYIIVVLIYSIIGFIYGLVIGQSFIEVADSMENMNSILDRIITTITIALIMFLIEYFSNGRSLGKLITGTKVIKIDGTKPTLKDFFIRNISRAVPFDQLSFLGSLGWHDSWSDTRVVKVKDYEYAIGLQKDMEDLGKPEN